MKKAFFWVVLSVCCALAATAEARNGRMLHEFSAAEKHIWTAPQGYGSPSGTQDLQAWIDSLTPPFKVFLPPGTYSGITLYADDDGATIEGSGSGTTVRMVQLNVDGVVTDTLDRVTLSNFVIYDSAAHGVQAQYCQWLRLNGLDIHHNAKSGVSFAGRAYPLGIENPIITNCDISYNGDWGLWAYEPHDFIVSNCQFEENDTTSKNKSQIRAYGGWEMLFANCSIDDGNGWSITLDAVVSSKIENCLVQQSGQVSGGGIRLINGTTQTIVEGLQLFGGSATENRYAIYVDNASHNNTFADLHISTNSGTVRIESDYNRLDGLSFGKRTTKDIWGIHLINGADNNVVTNCVFHQVEDESIQVDSDNNVITNNTIISGSQASAGTGSEIYISAGGSGNVVYFNTAINDGQGATIGIKCAGSGNTFFGNTTSGYTTSHDIAAGNWNNFIPTGDISGGSIFQSPNDGKWYATDSSGTDSEL